MNKLELTIGLEEDEKGRVVVSVGGLSHPGQEVFGKLMAGLAAHNGDKFRDIDEVGYDVTRVDVALRSGTGTGQWVKTLVDVYYCKLGQAIDQNFCLGKHLHAEDGTVLTA